MNLRAFIEAHEGRRHKVYKDSVGIPTVGVGFNLRRPDARFDLEELGVDYGKLVRGEIALTDEQVDTLLLQDIDDAVSDCRVLMPGYDSLPEAIRAVLADMRFNLGPVRMRAFRYTLLDIKKGDYASAADRLEKSLWYKQVGQRARRICAMLRAED